MTKSKMLLTGLTIKLYRDHLEAALEMSRKMADEGFERPWFTVACKRLECNPNTLLYVDQESKPVEHTHRIRLEIR